MLCHVICGVVRASWYNLSILAPRSCGPDSFTILQTVARPEMSRYVQEGTDEGHGTSSILPDGAEDRPCREPAAVT